MVVGQSAILLCRLITGPRTSLFPAGKAPYSLQFAVYIFRISACYVSVLVRGVLLGMIAGCGNRGSSGPDALVTLAITNEELSLLINY